jgi:hypothetical protein
MIAFNSLVSHARTGPALGHHMGLGRDATTSEIQDWIGRQVRAAVLKHTLSNPAQSRNAVRTALASEGWF